MKTKLHCFFIGLALLAGVHLAAAQSAQFFRIVGPTVTTITQFGADGTLVWSNATPGATYMVQMVTALPGGNNWVDYNQIVASSSVSTNMIFAFNPPAGMALIPAGEFTIGDINDNNEYGDAAPTNVYVSAFYMDTNLVSLSQWQGIYSYATNHGYGFVNAGTDQAANYPVETVDWYDCVKWCNARSQQAGLTPVYYTDTNLTQIYTNGEVDTVFANWLANGYRLPTEAEWEKAARGGLSGQRFPWGDTISWSQANYYGDPRSYGYDLAPYGGYDPAFTNGTPGTPPYTSPVGYFAPNGYGLYDMAGNVLEWCWDWYAAPTYPAYVYPAGSPYLGGTDPRGPVGPLSNREFRGGSWGDPASWARCANRNPYGSPHTSEYFNGFRCVQGL